MVWRSGALVGPRTNSTQANAGRKHCHDLTGSLLQSRNIIRAATSNTSPRRLQVPGTSASPGVNSWDSTSEIRIVWLGSQKPVQLYHGHATGYTSDVLLFPSRRVSSQHEVLVVQETCTGSANSMRQLSDNAVFVNTAFPVCVVQHEYRTSFMQGPLRMQRRLDARTQREHEDWLRRACLQKLNVSPSRLSALFKLTTYIITVGRQDACIWTGAEKS